MILGIIPARGGSKGIPRKNIKTIAGKPLIAWTIESALGSRLLDRVVVSTEDTEIAAVSKKYKAEVVTRPKKLATDGASTLSVLQHVLEDIDADTVVLLQPTSPIRSEGLIDRCIKEFNKKKVNNLATGFICKYKEYGSYSQRRQDLQGFFYDDGNVYVLRSSLIKQGKMFTNKAGRVITTREENIEIDEDFDFWLAEQVLLKNKRGFSNG